MTTPAPHAPALTAAGKDTPEIKAFRTAALDAIQSLRHAAACNFTPEYSGAVGEARCKTFYEAYEAVRTLPAPALPAGEGAGLREAAQNAEMYLRTGFINCERCGHEQPIAAGVIPGGKWKEGCCSAISPCPHQQRDKTTLCEVCERASCIRPKAATLTPPADLKPGPMTRGAPEAISILKAALGSGDLPGCMMPDGGEPCSAFSGHHEAIRDALGALSGAAGWVEVERIGKDRRGVSVIFARSEYDSESHRIEEPLNGLVVVLDADGAILSLDIEDLKVDMTAPVEVPADPKPIVPRNDAGMRKGPSAADHARAWVAAEYRVTGSPHEHTVSDSLAMARYILSCQPPADRELKPCPEENEHLCAFPSCNCARHRLAPQTGSAGEDETGVREALKQTADALANMMGFFDSPICRRKYPPDEYMQEAIQTGRDALPMARAALAPQPPKAETPAGVGERCPACEDAFCDDHGCAKGYPRNALSAAPAARPGDGVERVRHVKSGGVYEVLGEAEAQVSRDAWGPCSSRTIFDGCKITVYRDPKSGKLWCRFTDEFRDGRFVPAAAPAADGGRA